MKMVSATAIPEEPNHREAIGRKERTTACIDEDRVAALAATLDLPDAPVQGEPLPPCWHWLYFNPFVARSRLGADGHPRRGGFLPDVGLPRRMWAGGRIRHKAPVPVGAVCERESEILDVVNKTGRGGQLVFVTVRHVVKLDGAPCIEEEQDIVYREAPPRNAARATPPAAPEGAHWSETFTPDPVLLFRYSALTSNGHRIHYDKPYAVSEEGYPEVVVHGPLIATLLQAFALRCRPGRRVATFEFRAVAPLFADRGFVLEAAPTESNGGLAVWARGPDGELAMRVIVGFAP